MNPTESVSWQNLAELAQKQESLHLEKLVDNAPRLPQLQHTLAGLYFDFSKQRVDTAVLNALVSFASEMNLEQRIKDMLSGRAINLSENQAALHAALRKGADPGAQVMETISLVQDKMRLLANRIRSGTWLGTANTPISDIVHIGIGGSHLGPDLVIRALSDHHTGHLRVHFVANIDANDLHETLEHLNPETTLFIIASKSFGTLETQVNALTARSWFLERTGAKQDLHKHFLGVTANVDAAIEFGLDPENLLPMWDWVGGRFSLWSAVGLPILLALGETGYDELLTGARLVDEHFATTPLERNVPVLSALFAIWNYNFLGASSLAVLSYDQRLDLLPDYLQQLEMESNGKSVNLENQPVNYHTMPVLWGGVGTLGQHAYHQLLHQGTREYAADFIMVAADDRGHAEHHNWLCANALAQSQAMAQGVTSASEPHRAVRGNHPSTTIIMDALSPQQLGAILAVYEHKVFCQGVFWNINSFDQWGVELGKKLAIPIFSALTQSASPHQDQQAQDAATQSLIHYLLQKKV
ncbi:MAG: glucose-6-phosphate isomerase [Pseudomonadota bacterium]